jgi:hypothetical protein
VIRPPLLRALVLGLGAVSACAAFVQASGAAPDSTPSPPRPKRISYYYDAFDQSVFRPMARALDPATVVRAIRDREAANVDEQDQVRLPSTWWQPRLGFRPVSAAQMLRGPGPGTGPRRDRKWAVTGLKTQGVSLGIRIKDAEGQTFQLKFDPPKWPEMATGADAVVSRLFWAAGYNVPDNAVVTFTRDDLELREGATYRDEAGRKRPLSWPVVDRMLANVPRQADGAYRAVASRFLSGKPLGEWEYRGRRKDDPEDRIPHQHRREVRGLYAIAAWTNHTDGSARNTLDLWVDDGGRSFVRHYLIDFSGCLGSGSIDRQTYATGTEHFVDYGTAFGSLLTLGLRPFRWERTVDPGLPAVGFFESSVFDPADWRPFLPNPAFDERTERDAQWGARIVAAFSDEHIRAAVALGRYSDPRAAEYITRTLIERRDKIVARWPPAPQPAIAGPEP